MSCSDSIHKNYKLVEVTMPGPDGKKLTREMKMVLKESKYNSVYSPYNHPAWQKGMDLSQTSEGRAKQFTQTFGDIEY